VLPLSLLRNRDRLATFAALFLAGGLTFTLTLVVTLYAENMLGYTARRAGFSFIPFVAATAAGMALTSRLMTRFSPRVVVIWGSLMLVAGLVYASTLTRTAPYFPNLLVPMIVAGVSLAMMTLPLTLSVIASVEVDRVGPASAIAIMLQSLGEPIVLAAIQAVMTSRTLREGGVAGSIATMNRSELDALDHGYIHGLLWLAGLAVVVAAVALAIRYTPQQVAVSQEARDAVGA
jgi:MFS family permease